MRRLFFAALVLIAPAAFGTNSRSAVSVNGSDLNPCTAASPCRSFATAVLATSSGGEVVALDSAGYGTFTITSGMTVSGAPGTHAAITSTSIDGIVINASIVDEVTLRNLVLIGPNATNTLIGIHDLYSSDTRVIDCLVRGFSTGIQNDIGHLTVDHCVILDASSHGVAMMSDGNSAANGDVVNSLFENDSDGVLVFGRATATVSGSTILSGGNGVFAESDVGTGAVPARATVENCTLSHNTEAIASRALGGTNSAKVYISQNTIAYNSVGVLLVGNGLVYSFQNNRFTENGSGSGPFPSVTLE